MLVYFFVNWQLPKIFQILDKLDGQLEQTLLPLSLSVCLSVCLMDTTIILKVLSRLADDEDQRIATRRDDLLIICIFETVLLTEMWNILFQNINKTDKPYIMFRNQIWNYREQLLSYWKHCLIVSRLRLYNIAYFWKQKIVKNLKLMLKLKLHMLQNEDIGLNL